MAVQCNRDALQQVGGQLDAYARELRIDANEAG
jgi:hypothetical protein